MDFDRNFDPYEWFGELRCSNGVKSWPTIPEIFSFAVTKYPSDTAFSTYVPEYESYTYSESYAIIRGLASALVGSGLKNGDKVAVMGKNSPQWAMAYFAVLFAGGVVVPLDALLYEDEVCNLSKFAGVEFAFADSDKTKLFSFLEKDRVICMDDGKSMLDFSKSVPFSADLRFAGNSDEVAAILFTSGTTGVPKGVVLTHANFVSDAYYAQKSMRIYHSDVFYALLPIHHAYTFVSAFLVPVSQGAHIVFGKRMVTRQIFSDMKKSGVTMFLGVPVLYNKIISGIFSSLRKKGLLLYGMVRFLMVFLAGLKKLTRIDLAARAFRFITSQVSMDKIRICISGAGPLATQTLRHFNRLGICFVQGYGMTETSPIISLNPIYAYRMSSVGRVLDGIEVKIDDKDSRGNGVIKVRGPIVMKEYYRNPQLTSETIDSDGFLNTGDIGHLDSDNYLYLTGRAKNIIVTSGGKNVFPEEIEDEFQLYSDIDQIMVAGYDMDDDSEGIQAIVHPSDDLKSKLGDDKLKIRAAIDSIIGAVNKKLVAYKRISKVSISSDPLETTSTKKIKRGDVMSNLGKKELY